LANRVQTLAQKWKREQAQRILGLARKALQPIELPSGVMRAFHLVPLSSNHERALLKRHATLPMEDPVRVRLESWLATLRRVTKRRSQHSLHNVMKFYLRMLPRCGLRLDDWRLPDSPDWDALARRSCVSLRELNWFQLFVTHIVGSTHKLSPDLARALRKEPAPDDGHDVHRISTPHLEQLYDVAKEHPFRELMFLMLLTTGMRIGAYARMQCKGVADLAEGRWVVRDEGTTLEKGSKLLCFKMHERVKVLLQTWLNKQRHLDQHNPFVFPGQVSGHRGVLSFKRHFTAICKAAKLSGREFHPHSLRHCFTHILIEQGNPTELVSKLLNHRSVLTTQKYYGRESSAEVSRRANIPWFEPPDPRQSVPKFLLQTSLGATTRAHHAQHAAAQTLQLEQIEILRRQLAKTERDGQ
jgi:integrase